MDELHALIRATTAATIRSVAEWGLTYRDSNPDKTSDELHEIARQVDLIEADEVTCPVCEESVCDEGCPLEPIRRQRPWVQAET